MKTSKSSVILSVISCSIVLCTPLSAVVVLDNTAGLTESIVNNLGSISTTNWNEKVFTTGSANTTIDTVSLALYASTTPGSYTVNFSLYEVSSGNGYVPTGIALATASNTITLTTSASYYTFSEIFSSFLLNADTTYGLVVNSTASGTNCSWTNVASAYTGSEGFSYVTGLRTTNSGSSWSTNTFYNAMQVTVIPEPSTYAICSGMLVMAFAVRRRVRC